MEDYTPTAAERREANRYAAKQERNAVRVKLYYRTGKVRYEYKTFEWKEWPYDLECHKRDSYRYEWKAEWLTKTAKVYCVTMFKGKKEIILRGKKLKRDM